MQLYLQCALVRRIHLLLLLVEVVAPDQQFRILVIRWMNVLSCMMSAGMGSGIYVHRYGI